VRRRLAAVLALLLVGCSAAPRVIPIAVAPGQAPPAADRIADYPEAFQAIGVVMSRDLGLPVPPVSLYLYPNRDAFEQGLKAERHMEPGLARDAASFARGVGGPDKILVNEQALVRTPWPERVKFLAHEFTHTIQFDLAGGRRGRSAQWLREGSASSTRCGSDASPTSGRAAWDRSGARSTAHRSHRSRSSPRSHNG